MEGTVCRSRRWQVNRKQNSTRTRSNGSEHFKKDIGRLFGAIEKRQKIWIQFQRPQKRENWDLERVYPEGGEKGAEMMFIINIYERRCQIDPKIQAICLLPRKILSQTQRPIRHH